MTTGLDCRSVAISGSVSDRLEKNNVASQLQDFSQVSLSSLNIPKLWLKLNRRHG